MVRVEAVVGAFDRDAEIGNPIGVAEELLRRRVFRINASSHHIHGSVINGLLKDARFDSDVRGMLVVLMLKRNHRIKAVDDWIR